MSEELSPKQIRNQQFDEYWEGDLTRRCYLLRRQRKAILANCRRIAVVGASSDPNSASYMAIEKLLGLGLEIIPIFADRESFLGLRCFRSLRDVPAKIDILQIYPDDDINFVDLARAAVDQGVNTFWIEQGVAASRAVEDILVSGPHPVGGVRKSRGRVSETCPVSHCAKECAAQGSESDQGQGADVEKSRDGETG